MLTKEQKKEIVKKLTERLKEAKVVVFSDFKGFGVKDMTNLKRELKKEGSNFEVVKKSLINIALKNANAEADIKGMEGQVALSISNQDETTAAKIIDKFSKSNENLKMLGGVLGIKALSADEVKALAKLPSKEELLAKLVGSLSAPMRGLVTVFQGNQRGLVQVLKAISDKK